MDLGSLLDEKLAVRYDGGQEEKARRNLKRKEKFKKQIKAAVIMMEVKVSSLGKVSKKIRKKCGLQQQQKPHVWFLTRKTFFFKKNCHVFWLQIYLLSQEDKTFEYQPGRKYEKQTKKRFLREERVNGVPHSMKKLNKWIKEKRRDLTDHVKETEDKPTGAWPIEEGGEDDGDRHLEVGPVGTCLSEDEEIFSDEDINND